MTGRFASTKNQNDVAELNQAVDDFHIQPRYTIAELLAVPKFVMPSIAEKTTIDVLVEAVGEVNYFVSLVSLEAERKLYLDQLDIALEFMNRYLTCWSRNKVEVIPQPNNVYAVRSTGKWFRVKVLYTNAMKNTAKVNSLDYGWTRFVDFQDFRMLPLDFITQSPSCSEVSFIDYSPPNLRIGEQITLKLIEKDNTGKWRVSLMNQIIPNRSFPPGNGKESPAIGVNNVGQVNRSQFCHGSDNRERNRNNWPNRGSAEKRFGELQSGRQDNVNRETDKPPPQGKNLYVRKNTQNPQPGDEKIRLSVGIAGLDRSNNHSIPSKQYSDSEEEEGDGRNVDKPEHSPHTPSQPSKPTGQNHRQEGGADYKKENLAVSTSPLPLVPVQGQMPTKQVRYRDTLLPSNKVSNVVIVYSGKEGIFAIPVTVIENFKRIEYAINRIDKRDLSLTVPSLNKLCLAPYGDEMYRARVIHVRLEEFICRVLFLDYGNEADINMKDIRELPEGIPQDVYTFKMDYEGSQPPPVPETELKVLPISTRNDGTIEVQLQE